MIKLNSMNFPDPHNSDMLKQTSFDSSELKGLDRLQIPNKSF